jgi:hypothetical protein
VLPTVLGAGERLFDERATLQLTASDVRQPGLLLRYEVSGRRADDRAPSARSGAVERP